MPRKPGENAFESVMREFKEGSLKSGKPGPGKGQQVRTREQALAIAAHKAGLPRKGAR